MRTTIAMIAACLFAGQSRAIEPMPSGQLELELNKLLTLGSALYVAAHPDDENTKLITYLANETKAHTTYLSLTRGDGGQNLLGADLGEKLGIIRTHELLAARRIDGGEQLFSRANDFGYSKTPEETLAFWGREEILADTVWAIRLTRPDVIITRFAMEPDFTHGHHTAATWLAMDAFTAAADPNRFPEQLTMVEPWAAKRLIWNTSHWFYQRRNIVFDPTGLLSVDTGVYNPLLGAAYSEIAARSRSAHKTQGFGATAELGVSMEYFIHLAGEPTTNHLFEGIDLNWSRVPGGEPVAEAIRLAIDAFSPREPANAVPHLIEAHRALSALPDQFWKTKKRRDLERVIAACLGLDVESVTTQPSAVPGGEVALTINAVQRSPLDVHISCSIPFDEFPLIENQLLSFNELAENKKTVSIPADLPASQPYWLIEPHEIGRYEVADPSMIGTPENPPAVPVSVRVTVDGYPLDYTIPTSYKYNDPVHGEVKEPFVLTPPVMVNLPESPRIFSRAAPEKISARIIARSAISNGQLRFIVEDGWKVDPPTVTFDAAPGEEISVETKLTPPSDPGRSTLRAEIVIAGQTYDRGFERITYDHIPVQTIFPRAHIQLVLLDVETAGERIGYIPGAGDAIPEALARIGYSVDMLSESDMNTETLSRYSAIVLGIRALNTNERIGFYMPALFEYANRGGVVILQYNVHRGLKTTSYSPHPFTISQERVSDETAEMRILAPDHPVLNFPNRITGADFSEWVQERGLYFASSWDEAFTPIFSANDPGDKPSDGGLLVARHGDGWFVYTGISWFRQLPAGVPGAYRLFANLVSLGHAP
ncbi:MAG TPA: PIG-L family deacetylase [Kiritimatiellia bacterium]|nr:PIG-L family deacetylase [Kiritimatiellia bacterium]